ncbi:MAG TPA: signal peptidase I [Clostridiales bacterium]|nr:signal peptidase I [Clostridiales bacterium]HBW05792.1 signal peptidase I [Clostridiales bacterium]
MKNNEQSKAKKIYNVASTVVVALIFVFMIVVVAVMLIQKNNGGESKIFGYYMYDVLTDSMSGTIEPGDVIMCKAVEDVNELKEGDIITFKAPNGNYNETHRIIGIARNEDGSVKYFKTKGDNAKEADSWELNPENVKAKYVKKSVFIGGLRRFMKHWYGYVVVVVIPLCVVFALIIAGFVKDKVALESEKEKNKAISISDISDEDKKKLLANYLSETENVEKTAEKEENGEANRAENEDNRAENRVENRTENGEKREEKREEKSEEKSNKNDDLTEN